MSILNGARVVLINKVTRDVVDEGRIVHHDGSYTLFFQSDDADRPIMFNMRTAGLLIKTCRGFKNHHVAA